MWKKQVKVAGFLFLAVLMVASLIYSATPTKAYTGGLLNGQTMNVGADKNTTASTTTLATDNDEATYAEIGPDGSTTDTIWYVFGTVVNDIDSYKLKGVSNGEWMIAFYDVSDVMIGTEIIAVKSLTPTINNFSEVKNGVKKVAVRSTHVNALAFYEFDIFQAGDVTSPAAPIGLNATPGNTEVSLTWNANTETDLQGYNVYRDGVKINTATVTTTTYLDIGLTNGQTYSYQISAIDTNNNESALSTAVQATPQAPSIGRALLVITMVNGLEKEYDLSMTQVNAFIDWYDTKAAGTGPARYVIEKDYNIGPFTSRKDNIIYEKIMTFEVMEYQVVQ